MLEHTMRIFTPGNSGFVPDPVAVTLGLGPRQQARILVADTSKSNAYKALAQRNLEPTSHHDPEFRTAMGDDVDVLTRAGQFEAPTVLALDNRAVTDVVRIEQDGSPTLVGRIERDSDGPTGPLRFVPTAAGVDGPQWAEPMGVHEIAQHIAATLRIDLFRANEVTRERVLAIASDPSKWDPETGRVHSAAVAEVLGAAVDQVATEDQDEARLIAACVENRRQVNELTTALAALRIERQQIALRAVHMDLVSQAAKAFDLSVGRVYQLKDAALIADSPQKAQGPILAAVLAGARTKEQLAQQLDMPLRPVFGNMTLSLALDGLVVKGLLCQKVVDGQWHYLPTRKAREQAKEAAAEVAPAVAS